MKLHPGRGGRGHAGGVLGGHYLGRTTTLTTPRRRSPPLPGWVDAVNSRWRRGSHDRRSIFTELLFKCGAAPRPGESFDRSTPDGHNSRLRTKLPRPGWEILASSEAKV